MLDWGDLVVFLTAFCDV